MNLNETQLQILKLINLNLEISRKELSVCSGLSRAAVTLITRELINQNYIIEGKERTSSGPGRKEVNLQPNPDRFRFLGIDIGGHSIRMALSDNNLKLLYQREIAMADFEHITNKLEALSEQILNFLQQNDFPVASLDAIGIGVTGIVNLELSHILNIPNAAGWDDLPIVAELQKTFGCPVFLEEGGRTMAMAEKLVGKAKDVDNFIVAHFGKGIVAGIVNHGQLIRGASNVGGLLGHITVNENGERCTCGNFGCLETYGLFQIIENNYRILDQSPPSLVEAYQQNNKAALELCIEAGNFIGIALSNIVNLFNPQSIYLGGHLFESLPLVLEELKRTVRRRANRFANVVLEFELSSFGNLQGIYGAITLAKSKLLS